MARSGGTWKKGDSRIPKSPGRPRSTLSPEERLARKLTYRYARQRVNTFKEACESLLPIATQRVQEILERKGTKREGSHLRAIEILGDRVYGRPAQAITGANGGPLAVTFTELVGKANGAKDEQL
jgi:hypothetical protein